MLVLRDQHLGEVVSTVWCGRITKMEQWVTHDWIFKCHQVYVTLLPQRDGNKTLNFQKCLHADQTSMFGIQLKRCLCGAAGKGGSHRHEGAWGNWAVHRRVWPVSLTSSTQHLMHRTIQTYSIHNSSGGSVSRAPHRVSAKSVFHIDRILSQVIP